ncbi:MAG TPA: M20/M25/M40 family metallo-hydrolase [Thermoanaerobaculia bacterium]|jgi:Zn-dependent M28 family amino/carboxypeptidase|nr:M20/M25/M40 family metallo-hydrolase [Thermoanaerobaculia bacterium]
MNPIRTAILFALALPLLAQDIPPSVKQSFDTFRVDAVRAHLKFLSSDLLEGRGPGTRGDALATGYIASQFEAMGLKPAGDDGTYFQKVSLLGITTDEPKSKVTFRKDGADLGPLKYRDQFVGGSQSQKENVSFDSEVVFVGHGVAASEYRWDDYKGFDPKGKTLVMLVDDPPATEKEPDLFKGRARTYYGRWTYKFEQGAARGAEAVLLIHTDRAAGYGWQVVRNSWTGEQAYVKNAPGQHALSFAGWISETVAQELFKNAGLDLAALTKAAGSRDFKPVPLGFRLAGNVASTIRPFDTANVVAKLEGSDAQLKNEAILYTAHHDHLGIGNPDDDDPTDTIYNGAIDNASGTATILEVARVWSETSPRPKRSVVFAFVAAEEQGLLGSEYFGEHPVVPAGRIAMGLNIDAIHLLGNVGSVSMIGIDRTTFFPTAQKVTKALNLTIVPDQAPEQGSYYRSDHFSLAKVGVPAFSIKQGNDVLGKPADWGQAKSKEYRDKHYHQASDEYDPAWDFGAAVQAGRLAFWLGWEAANASAKPMWLPGEEFYEVTAKVRGK